MDDSQAVSVETWLVNRKPSLDRSFRLSFDGASFIEMDPNLPPSKRFLLHQHQDHFDFKVLPSSQNPVHDHADKLISHGTLLPLPSESYSSDSIPLSSTTQGEGRFRSLRKCNKLPKMIIQKYMDLVRPLWCRMRRGKSAGSRVKGVKNWECSSGADNLQTSSCDSESSIYEAVVHCKKTIGMN